MGMFDTYGDIQLKAGIPALHQFSIGDRVFIPDGVYVDDEGLVVISGSKFIAQLDKLYNYFGEELDKYQAQVQ